MCQAIVACASVDEVKDIRDKARALEVYAQQALNTDVERKAAEIRIRAERRAGELLKDMKETGAREIQGGDRKSKSEATTLKLDDLGITKDESSKWQKLAEIPEEKFEAAVSDPEIKEADWECSLVLKALRTQVGDLLQGVCQEVMFGWGNGGVLPTLARRTPRAAHARKQPGQRMTRSNSRAAQK